MKTPTLQSFHFWRVRLCIAVVILGLVFAMLPTNAAPVTPIGNSGPLPAGKWVDIKLSNIAYTSQVSIELSTTSTDRIVLSSREDKLRAPRIIKTNQAGSIEIFSIADTYTNSKRANKNFGDRIKLRVDASPTKRAYLKFNMPVSLPQEGMIGTLPDFNRSYVLRVYSHVSNSKGFSVVSTRSDWEEQTLTHNKRPKYDETPTSSTSTSTSSTSTSTTSTSSTSTSTTSTSSTSTSTTSTSTTSTTRPVTPPTPGKVWVPKPGTSWYWQINGKVDETVPVTMYDVDLFEAVPSTRTYNVAGFGNVTVPKGDNAGVIDRLHAKGKIVICYVDTGAAENNRPDINLIPESVRGSVAEASDGTQWDERWLDTRQASWSKWAPVMWARFDLAKAIGCDGVEPDQNNHVGNETGFPESVAIDRAWYLEVAKQAHARGLSVGMKNGIEAINADLVNAYDWHLNEECNQYDECDVLSPFISAGKAVFNAEYPKVKNGAQQSETCATAKKLGLSSMGYPLELGGGYFYDCITGTSRPTGTKK